MHAAALTFETMGRKADRTLGIVLFAKHVRHELSGIVLFTALDITLRSLLKSVSGAERLNSLSEEQVKGLTSSLREVHSGINELLNSGVMSMLNRRAPFRRLIDSIEERTEDLYDIIENLTLSENADFRNVIADAVKSISLGCTPETVGRM